MYLVSPSRNELPFIFHTRDVGVLENRARPCISKTNFRMMMFCLIFHFRSQTDTQSQIGSPMFVCVGSLKIRTCSSPYIRCTLFLQNLGPPENTLVLWANLTLLITVASHHICTVINKVHPIKSINLSVILAGIFLHRAAKTRFFTTLQYLQCNT